MRTARLDSGVRLSEAADGQSHARPMCGLEVEVGLTTLGHEVEAAAAQAFGLLDAHLDNNLARPYVRFRAASKDARSADLKREPVGQLPAKPGRERTVCFLAV